MFIQNRDRVRSSREKTPIMPHFSYRLRQPITAYMDLGGEAFLSFDIFANVVIESFAIRERNFYHHL